MKTIHTQDYNEVMPTTAGINGYPVPEIGIFIFANSFKELTDIIDNLDQVNDLTSDVKISIARWRDGWNTCEDINHIIYDYNDAQSWYDMALQNDFFEVIPNMEYTDYIVKTETSNTNLYPINASNGCIAHPYHFDVWNYRIGVFIEKNNESIKYYW